MPVSKALVEQLLALPEDLRGELGDLLNAGSIVDRIGLGQTLLESLLEEMSDEERAALDAALDASHADVEAGRTVPAEEVIARLMARDARRAAG